MTRRDHGNSNPVFHKPLIFRVCDDMNDHYPVLRGSHMVSFLVRKTDATTETRLFDGDKRVSVVVDIPEV